MVGSAVSIVDAGFRGVLLHWNAVDLVDPPLEEGLHFIVPFQDSVIPLEVRTLKYTKSTTSASQDLQTVSTEITVNYHPEPTRVNYLYKEVGLDYENRIIQPTVEEVVKQVTANYNAEELITKRPLVKQDIQDEIIGLDFINELRPVTFLWKKANEVSSELRVHDPASNERVMDGKYNHGFIAQEVKEVLDRYPIKEGFDFWKEDPTDGRQRVAETALVPILVKAFQELSAENKALSDRLTTLENK